MDNKPKTIAEIGELVALNQLNIEQLTDLIKTNSQQIESNSAAVSELHKNFQRVTQNNHFGERLDRFEKNLLELGQYVKSISDEQKAIKTLSVDVVSKVGLASNIKTPDNVSQLVKLNKLMENNNTILDSINIRQHKENRRSFFASIITFGVMAGLAYLSIHLDLFDKDIVRAMLIGGFDYLFGIHL